MIQKFMKNKLLTFWKPFSLKPTTQFIRGVTFSKNMRQAFPAEDSIPIVTTKAAQEDGVDHTKLYFIPQKLIKRSEQILRTDDIIISIANSLELVGRVTPVRAEDAGLTWGAFLGVLRADSKFLFPRFLYLYLKYGKTKEFFKKNAKTTTNISNISSDTILSCSIPMPPLAEQKRIVKKIEGLFTVIDKNIKQLEQTQQALIQYRQSVLQQAFSGKLHKTTNWKDRCFSDLCTYIQRGKSPKYIMQSVLPVINQRCIRWNELQLQYLKFIDPAQFSSWTSERHLQPMDILWNSTGTGTIGRAYLYKGTELSDAVVDSHVTILRVNAKEVYARFLFLYIQSPLVQNRIEKIQSGSTNQVELARKEIQAITIPLPSLPEQKAIVAKIEKAFACADKAQAAISAALQQAKQLKQSILKRAFEGKLVPQDPNDKPVDLSQLKTHKGKTK